MKTESKGIPSKIEQRTYPISMPTGEVDVVITCPKDLSDEDGLVLAIMQLKAHVDDLYSQTDGETVLFNKRVQKACEKVFTREEVGA